MSHQVPWRADPEGWNKKLAAAVEAWKAEERAERSALGTPDWLVEAWVNAMAVGLDERLAQMWAEAYAEGKRCGILHLLEFRFKHPIPADLVEAVGAQTDLDLLFTWFDHAVLSVTLDDFRAAIGN